MIQWAIFNEAVREFVKENKTLKGELNSAYGLIWGQCSPSIKCAIEFHKDYNHVTNTILHIHCHSKTSSTQLQTTFPEYGKVWFDPNKIANILSLSKFKKEYRLTFDSSLEAMCINKPDGSTQSFVALKDEGGLHYLDTHKQSKVHSTSFAITVEENKSNCTTCDVQRAELARKVLDMIGCPSTPNYIDIIRNNQ
jgi:hypothetical protein